MTQISPHFFLEEFTDSQTAARRGIENKPTVAQRANLLRTAETLEKVRVILDDHPIIISSGYRNGWVNSAVGGSKNSAHMHGLATDFSCPSFGSPLAICKALEPRMEELAIDQLIMEYDQWIHLGLINGKPRYQCLTIDKHGTRSGFG